VWKAKPAATPWGKISYKGAAAKKFRDKKGKRTKCQFSSQRLKGPGEKGKGQGNKGSNFVGEDSGGEKKKLPGRKEIVV